jgi:hypothetical protein
LLSDARGRLLRHKANIVELVTQIFYESGLRTAVSEAIIHVVRTLFDAYPLSLEELVTYVEDNITNREQYDVGLVTTPDAVTVQTIHGSKGLEPGRHHCRLQQEQIPGTGRGQRRHVP